MKKEKIYQQLLSHCSVSNRKLESDLLAFLNGHNLTFIELLTKLNIEVEFPLRLSGKLDNLLVTDNGNHSYQLQILKNIIISKEVLNSYTISYVRSTEDFSIESIEAIFKFDNFSFSLDSNNFFIQLLGALNDSVSIIFDESVKSSDIVSDEMFKICLDSLVEYSKLYKFDIESLDKQLTELMGNTYSIVHETEPTT